MLSATGLFKYVWPFSWKQTLKGYLLRYSYLTFVRCFMQHHIRLFLQHECHICVKGVDLLWSLKFIRKSVRASWQLSIIRKAFSGIALSHQAKARKLTKLNIARNSWSRIMLWSPMKEGFLKLGLITNIAPKLKKSNKGNKWYHLTL